MLGLQALYPHNWLRIMVSAEPVPVHSPWFIGGIFLHLLSHDITFPLPKYISVTECLLLKGTFDKGGGLPCDLI